MHNPTTPPRAQMPSWKAQLAAKDPKTILPTPVVPARTLFTTSHLCTLLLLISVISPLALITPLRAHLRPVTELLDSAPPPLTVVTLIYNQRAEHVNIAHNCALISPSRHRFIVYTDDLSQPYCHVCHCRLFVKRNCKCPGGDEDCEYKNPCEKLFFVIDVLKRFKELVFLDNDLLILKHYFLDRLQPRARVHDFLATYGHDRMKYKYKYNGNFNSGLMFIRWLPGLDYNWMKRELYNTRVNRDQVIISGFVQKFYDNWDTLSWKWHCRALATLNQTIPLTDCYTIHDRKDVGRVLKALNRTRLTIP